MTPSQKKTFYREIRLVKPVGCFKRWWVKTFFDIHIPNKKVCADHDAPSRPSLTLSLVNPTRVLALQHSFATAPGSSGQDVPPGPARLHQDDPSRGRVLYPRWLEGPDGGDEALSVSDLSAYQGSLVGLEEGSEHAEVDKG